MTDLLSRAMAAFDRGAGIPPVHPPGVLWSVKGWTCTLETTSRVRLDGPGGAVVYDLPDVDFTVTASALTPSGVVSQSAAKVVELEVRGAARELFHRTDSELTISGPAGTGKSLPTLMRVHLAALMFPGVRCLVARKVGVTLGATTLVTFEKKVAAEAIAAGAVTWYGGSLREAACYRYANGSTIVVGGLDKPTKIMSAEYDLIFVDEATEITVDDWEALSTRLGRNGSILPWTQQLGALNPGPPTHWIKQRSDNGGMPMLHSKHQDNPSMFDRDGNALPAGITYLAILDKLTGVRKLRLKDGIWAAAEGVIYGDWDESIHIVDALPPGSDDWTRYLAVDFGYTHAFVCQCWAVDGDGRLWLEWEIHMTGRTVDQHAVTIMNQLTEPIRGYKHPLGEPRYACHGRQWKRRKPRGVICDHDAEGRAVLERELGMGTTAAHKAVTEGIQAMQGRLRVAGDGKPRMFVLRNSLVEVDTAAAEAKRPLSFMQEITSYVWDTSKGKGVKETPVKEDDDSMDPARYMCAELDLAGQFKIRFM